MPGVTMSIGLTIYTSIWIPHRAQSLEQVRETAMVVHQALDALKIPNLAKTTGSRGIHIYVPIVRGPLQKEVWTFAKQFAQSMERLHPKLITAEYRIAKRPDRHVLVDYNQNAWGRTLASIYSVRPKPLAPVSTPVTWEEVESEIEVEDFTLKNVPARVRELGDFMEAVVAGQRAVPSRNLAMSLPLARPFPPMEARLVEVIPEGEGWQYEPKWDGFRCLVFRDGKQVELQSKSGQTMARYFPELVEAFAQLKPNQFVLDGEIAIPIGGHFSFNDLLQRIHPAESRIRKLSQEHPALFIAFDLLVDDGGKSLIELPLERRRPRLEQFAKNILRPGGGTLKLSPATTDLKTAKEWFKKVGEIWTGSSPNAWVVNTAPPNGMACKK